MLTLWNANVLPLAQKRHLSWLSSSYTSFTPCILPFTTPYNGQTYSSSLQLSLAKPMQKDFCIGPFWLILSCYSSGGSSGKLQTRLRLSAFLAQCHLLKFFKALYWKLLTFLRLWRNDLFPETLFRLLTSRDIFAYDFSLLIKLYTRNTWLKMKSC